MSDQQPSNTFLKAYLESPVADEVTQNTVTRLQGIERMTGQDLGSKQDVKLPAGEIAKVIRALNTETPTQRQGPVPKAPGTTLH